jgi:hypothetical protein
MGIKMASAIDPTLGGDLTTVGQSVDKADLVTALTAARDEISALQIFTTAAILPATLAAANNGQVLRVTSATGATTGTITVPAGSTLGAGFSCTIVNPTGSGFTRTITGPGATDVTLSAGETVTIDVLDDNRIVASEGTHLVLS